ncbi:MAG: hypothetical protein WBC49_08010 [Thermoplasmata archaeon]
MPEPWIDFTVALLITVVGALIGQVLRTWLQTRHQERELRRDKESMEFYADGVILTYGGGGKIYPFALAGFFLSMAVFMLIAKITNDYPPLVERHYETITLALMLFLFSLVPWLVFVQAYGVRHLVTTQGIFRRSPWLKPMYVTWDQVESVSKSFLLDAYVFHTSTGTIRVRSTLEDISYLEEMMRRKISANLWK